MVSLCIRQKGVFRTARRIRRIQTRESDLDDAERLLNVVKSESELRSSIHSFFLYNANSISTYTISMISIYLCMSDFITLAVNIRCSDTSTAVTLFGPANPVLSLIPNVRQLRLTV